VYGLSDLLDKRSPQGASGFCETINTIVDQGYLAEYVSSFIAGRASSLEFTPEAYKHPNGFTKFRLAVEKNGLIVRLHIWEEPFNQGDIHSHRWNFASRIVSGSVIESRYEARADEVGEWTQYECSKGKSESYLLQRSGNYSAHVVERNEYCKGQSYFRDHKALHHISIAGPYPVITLMIQSAPKVSSSQVLTVKDLSRERAVRIIGLSEMRAILSRFADKF
jgi:hypothetical protein